VAAGKKDAEEWQIDTPMSNSLRTTIPAYLVNQFDLKKGDKIVGLLKTDPSLSRWASRKIKPCDHNHRPGKSDCHPCRAGGRVNPSILHLIYRNDTYRRVSIPHPNP